MPTATAELDAATWAPAPGSAPAPGGALAPGDLAEVLQAYSAVAERLQASHETLQNEVARLRRELANKNAQLERSKRLSALGEMAAGIAHEIRNPLAAIQLYAELVEEDVALLQCEVRREQCAETPGGALFPVPSALSSALPSALSNTRKIASAVRGLSAIVVDVLSFARPLEPRVRPLDPAGLFHRVIDAHRPAIDAAAVTVKLDADDDPLHADPNLLHQALLNLARNAVDAMADRDGPRVLTLACHAGRVTVADTGPGLDEDTVDRIFNPFFTTRSTGTGLGLAIVHRIVDAHGGTIAVGRSDTGGAAFRLDLPTPRTSHFRLYASHFPRRRMSTKVLIVDDKQMMRDSVGATLQRAGYTVIAAADGDSALKMIGKHQPAAVVTDLKMPGMDGLELLGHLLKADPRLPVVLMTAYGSVNDAVSAMKAGAFDFIQKPFEGDQLKIVVRRAVQHRQRAQAPAPATPATPGGSTATPTASAAAAPDLVGNSPEMRAATAQVLRIADSHGTVLIQGESGTGKEVVARTLHANSPPPRGHPALPQLCRPLQHPARVRALRP